MDYDMVYAIPPTPPHHPILIFKKTKIYRATCKWILLRNLEVKDRYILPLDQATAYMYKYMKYHFKSENSISSRK